MESLRILSIAEAAEIVPLSEATLYRLAAKGEAPFTKRAGKWMVIEADLYEWVRAGDRGQSLDPMPRPDLVR